MKGRDLRVDLERLRNVRPPRLALVILEVPFSWSNEFVGGPKTKPDDAVRHVANDVRHLDRGALGRAQVNLDIGNFPRMYTAIFDDLNARGGINGRKVVPVFAPINPLGTSPAQEACVKPVEDEKVFAVTGFFLGDAPLCYVEQYQTPVVG